MLTAHTQIVLPSIANESQGSKAALLLVEMVEKNGKVNDYNRVVGVFGAEYDNRLSYPGLKLKSQPSYPLRNHEVYGANND